MHVDAGTLVGLRDGLAPDALTGAHLRACAACAGALTEASQRAALVSEALATLDAPLDLVSAKAATRARLDRSRSSERSAGWRSWPLGRAAVLLLATAGAVSALTWTPLRSRWSTPEPSPAAVPPATTAVPSTAPAQQLSATTGIAVDVAAIGIDVVVRGAAPGSLVEVVWGPDSAARVVGPAGSGFTYGEGRLQIEAGAGDLRLELPRAARSTVAVDGRVYVARSGLEVIVSEPTLVRTDDLVRFVVPGR